jgi:hypothetical protein
MVKVETLPPGIGAAPAAFILPPSRQNPGFLATARPKQRDYSDVDPADENGFLTAIASGDHRLAVCGEYLLWWAKNQQIPVLGTTGTVASGGVLGQPGTQNLFGPGPIDQSERQGARLSASLWLDQCQTIGLDAHFIFLGRRQSSQSADSGAFPVISRPVFVLNTNSQDVEIVAFPGISTGSLRIDSASEFWGADANIIKRICSNCYRDIDIFVGYRYLRLAESIAISESITAGPGASDPAGTQVFVKDRFATQNNFHGGQVGFHVEEKFDRLFVELRSAVALGVSNQSVDIDGVQIRTRPGEAPQQFVGGLLAARSNIGHFERSRFSVVPEVNLNIGYQFTPRFRAFVGYNFLYWSSVLRPGDQIDRTVDLTQIPNTPPVQSTGQARPGVLLKDSSFWVQGVSVGLQWVW